MEKFCLIKIVYVGDNVMLWALYVQMNLNLLVNILTREADKVVISLTLTLNEALTTRFNRLLK